MHPEFADWYSIACPEPTAERLQLRWRAVEVFASNSTPSDVLDLVRKLYSRPLQSDLGDRFRQTLKAEDPTYLLNRDGAELAVLAGATIVSILTRGDRTADIAALGVLCMNLRGTRSELALPQVVTAAKQYLADQSLRVRKPETPRLDRERIDKALAELKSKTQGNDLPGTAAAFEGVLCSIREHALAMADAIDALESRHREESDILWWVVGERTRDLQRHFSDLDVGEACFIGARDLLTLTRFRPGPLSAPAFLDRVLRCCRPELLASIRISDAVNACSIDWRRDWASKLRVEALGDLSPCLFALVKSVEVNGGPEWGAAFKARTGIDADVKLDPLSVAVQIYEEAQLEGALRAN